MGRIEGEPESKVHRMQTSAGQWTLSAGRMWGDLRQPWLGEAVALWTCWGAVFSEDSKREPLKELREKLAVGGHTH